MMIHSKIKIQAAFKKITYILTAAIILSGTGAPPAAFAAEKAEKVYNGITNAEIILNNIDYNDVRDSETWAAEAIYESGALDVMKGYGNKQFGRTDVITKEQAIAIAYRAAGREEEALKKAEELDNARTRANKDKNVLGMQFDGYLQLAADDGLITAQDLTDAFNTDQTRLGEGSFFRSAPVQRQEMAYWLAKALELTPIYKDQAIFNNYNDWRSFDPIKVPYIEAVLQNKIMNGNGNGYFNPVQSLTREQAAQIIKNSSKYMLQAMNYEKHTGTIEDIRLSVSLSDGLGFKTAIMDIRNVNGKLHNIVVGYSDNPAQSDINEQNGEALEPDVLDTIVFKNGIISNSSALYMGDRIEYIVTPENTVKYIKVFSSTADTKYIAAQVKEINTADQTMNISQFFTLAAPDINIVKEYVSFDPLDVKTIDTYTYSSNAAVISDGRAISVSVLPNNSFVILTIVNNIITRAETFDVSLIKAKEPGIVNGIVEDNNPELGYITLYSEAGTGSSPQNISLLRTYYYSGDVVEVYRNHNKAEIQDIADGDSVFLKLDSSSYVISASSMSNYIIKYGKILSVNDDTIAVEYDDGLQQVLDLDDNVVTVIDGKTAALSDIKDGESVKLVLQITGKITKLKRITADDKGKLISNIYKGTLSYIDMVSNSIVLQNPEVLVKDRWVRGGLKGFTSIKLSDSTNLYSDNKAINIETANSILKGSKTYVAVEADYGGEEKVVLAAFQNIKDAEMPVIYDDSISGIGLEAGAFNLFRENRKIVYGNGTIIVKEGRLVSGSSIKSNDNAYVVASQSFTNGELKAGIVNIGERYAQSDLQVYRGRIKQINTNRNFTVESFSELNGLKWNYWNTPKTFNITYDTRILDDNGVVSQRDFKSYGDASYINKTVYIVAKDGEALLISTAPFYNPYDVKGEIYEITNGYEIKILNAKLYDPVNFVWKDSSEVSLDILINSVIIKGNNIISSDQLKIGDRIRAVKRDITTTGEAYIIFVED